MVTRMRQIIFDGKAVLADSSYPPEAWIVSADGRHEINKTVRELRQRVGLVYRGVDIRMQSIMRVPWQLRQGDNVLWYSEDDTVPDKFAWLEDLPDYIGLIEACLCLTSQSFLYKQSNRAGVRGLQWFSPLSVAPEWDESAGLKHFERRLSSRVDYYKPEDIVYVWRRDPLHETMPDTAPAQAAMASANVLYSIDQFVTGFFQRGAIKPMLLQVPQNTPQAERDKVKAWWDRFFSGVKDAWRTNVVTTEVKPVIVGEGLESLTNETLTQERRDDVATAIGVPHSLLFSNSANYATAKQDEQNFYTMTILPDVRLIQKQLNAQLFKALGLQLRFMPNEMDVFQEDEAARAQSFATYVGAGMKQSVAAQILGVELPDGVEYADLDPEPPPPVIMQAPPQQAPAQPDQPQEEQVPPVDDAQVQADANKAVEVATFKRWLKKRLKSDPCEFKSTILTDAEKHAIADDVRGEVAPEESFFTLPSGGITRDAYKALVLQLDPGDDEAEQKLRMAVEGRTYREMRRALRDMMDTLYPENWDTDDPNGEAERIHQAFLRDQKLRDTVSRAIQDSADLGVNMSIDTMENIGIAFDYTLAHEVARAWALTYTDDLLNQLGTTSGRLVGQAVARWFENGEPLQKLINDLDPVFGRKRAQLIATTEVTRAAAEGTRAGYKQSGVITELVWQTARDERTCPYCGALNGKVVGIDTSFSDALPEDLRAKVGRFQLPPAHPRCRCWVTPSIRELTIDERSQVDQQSNRNVRVTITGDTALLQQANFTQEKIAQLFDIGPSAIANIVVRGDSGEIEIAGKWTDRITGESIGECTRRLFPREKNAYLDVLAFEPSYIGNGVGMRVARQWFDALGEAGYKKAELYAGLSVGRYAWAKEGAKYIDRTQAARSTLLFREWIAEKGINLADNEYPTFTSVLDVATYAHPRGVTLTGKDITSNSVPADMVLPLGKAFMLDVSFNGHGGWNGVIDLAARKKLAAAKSTIVAEAKAVDDRMVYINSDDVNRSDALFWDAYLVDDDSDVDPLLGGLN